MAADESASIACPACGTLIDTTNLEPLARVACPKCGEKVRVERTFDNFVLLETLGVGGMGTVYKARDTLLDRLVALKLLRKDLGEEIDYGARLQHEARVAASVNHPNVIQVFSSGADHGQFYLVMELVDRGSLDDFIEEQKRLPEELVLEAGIQVATGLRAAYAKGLIHRDVKPANILFADEHTAKIGDFGLAGVAAETGENRGQIWGTPYYVAPERLNNEPEDFRSDIYSLGATLFHALAGRAPIEGETNSATTLRDLKNQPLDLSTIAPDVSAPTAQVLQRMIAPDPAKRFSSYDELVAELERAERKLTGKEDPETSRRKRRVLWFALVAVLVLSAIGGLVFARKSREQIRRAAAAAAAIPTSELERQYNEARRQLIAGKHNVAGAAFARIAIDAKNRQPLYDWIRLHEGLAALIAREPPQAKKAFQEVQNAGQGGFAKEDVDLSKFFLTTAKMMSAPGTIPASSANALRADTHEAFALFLFALKDIAQTDVNDAIPSLEKFLKGQLTSKFVWIAEYKALAQKYLDDCRTYAEWKSQSKGAPTGADVSAQWENVRTLKKKLKTRSAISDVMNAEEKMLAQRVAMQQKAQGAPTQPQSGHIIESPAWTSALTNYKQKIGAYDFVGAGNAVNAAKVSDPSSKQTQAAMQKKVQWLVDWKTKLIEDLNRKRFSGRIADVTGVNYEGVSSATSEQISLTTPYGIVGAPWIKLAPQTLLAISSSFIVPNAPDAADRQWLCAVFAAETGQGDSARQLAESAAKAKPEYQDQISLILSPPPAAH
ncbi:MAG: serine/threonine protein kinase [Verrucomicrobiota bacterium]|nr:serine/threonine protein kinase [Verrucomicrobiota bacterium]